MVKFKDIKSVMNLTVIVAGLGYFVDLFDITLYGVVRVASLTAIGITDPVELASAGITIYNAQMIGMMVGGVLWGIMGDKRGRLSVMFGSILLYSIANIANVFVWDVTSYAFCRFWGGVGLAGELGAAITLVAESLPKEKRGIGTTVVATLGMLGIVAAAVIGQYIPAIGGFHSWQVAYALGGFMGLALLLTRFKMAESSMFKETHATGSEKGNFALLLHPSRLAKYISCILIGTPIYFTTGVLFTFAPELTKGLGIEGVSAGNTLLWGSIGLAIGDLISGLFSQWLGSRKKAVAINLLAGFGLACIYTLNSSLTPMGIYVICFLIGITVGYWAVLVTMAAEQFGTNIRATAATTVPNFVRGSAVFAVSGFGALFKGGMAASTAALLVGGICFGLALLALTRIDETFHRDLDFEEGTGKTVSTGNTSSVQRETASEIA